MTVGRLISRLAALILMMFATESRAADRPWVGQEATRTRLTIVGVDGSSPKVVLDSPRRFSAPEWTPGGVSLIVNGAGKFWRLPASGGTPTAIPLGSPIFVSINHAISPDGKKIAFNTGSIWTVPAAGGKLTRVTSSSGNNLHGWSPDGKRLVYSSDRGKGLDLFSILADGGSERPLTTHPANDDAPQFSSDGRWVYFISDRSGHWDVWRVPAEGGGSDDAKAERITSDDRDAASPRCSPDGKWLVYASYPPRTGLNGLDRDVWLRRIALDGGKPGQSKPENIVRIVGGFGTLGARAFSPDSRRLVYASYEPPPPTIRLILYTPSDREPPANVPHRLTQIADATEKFLVGEMTRWNYPPNVSKLFRREADGTVEVTFVKGTRPASDPYYAKGSCRHEAIEKARERLRIDGEGHIWWTFLYLGERPTRFDNWVGGGCPRDGGWAVINYESLPGELRLDLNPSVGFNAEIYLKGTIHELGHAFGLPHIGPDPALKLGNSLMGPNNSAYAERKYPITDPVYLDEASAAMLWKHPILTGSQQDRQRQPTLKLVDFKPTYNRTADRITLKGKLVADMSAHTVVVLDDLGKPDDEYWYRSHAARIASDGSFEVAIDHPARADGHFRTAFCFENGAVTGDGAGVIYGDHGEIRTRYRFRDGGYTFGD
jgi:Tol biopolymer transport system component